MIFEKEEDLRKLIENKVEENTNLEYKDPEGLNNNSKIVKEVSAMANSNGGNIIYGISEEKGFPKEIVWLEDIKLKEKVEQVIHLNIIPKIIDCEVKIIHSEDDPKKFVIIIEVPKSDIAPHQAYLDRDNKRYYRRHGSIIKEMEHFEIEDLFFKRKRPSLKIGLRNISKEREKPAFEIYLENAGKVVAEQTYIKLKTPPEWNISGWMKTEDPFGYPSYEHVLKEDLVYPGLKQVIGIIYHPKKFEFGLLTLNFVIVCKNAEVLEGEIFIDDEEKLKVTYGGIKTHPYCQNTSDYMFSKNNPFDSKVD